MRITSLIFIFVIFNLNTDIGEHPLKMSFTKLIIHTGGNVELETRIFLDDLTVHMEKLYALQHADFSSTGSNGTQALQRYLPEHFYFEQDGNKLNVRINEVSFSKNRLALVINMSTPNQLDLSKDLFLFNTLLCDASLTQVNDIRYLDEHYKLSIGNPKVKIPIY